MTPERWQKIEELFYSALERPLDERAGFLDHVCTGDDALRKEIERLLSADLQKESLIEALPSMVAAGWVKADERRPVAGQEIGHYRIIAPLGSGGMGEVYVAEDSTLKRKIALKLLPQRYTTDPERVRRFELEARAASALNHPNIITIYEIGDWNGFNFIATEFVDGRTLRERMHQGSLKLSEILDIGLQSAGALSAAHDAGIVHRDVKPANIMIRNDGYVKVLDFGLAKLTAVAEPPEAKTDPGRVMGTVSYMSPEQAQGQDVDQRTDIFSLGVVLYELATGTRPFAGDSDAAVYAALLNNQPPPPLTSNPTLPSELDRIIQRALEKDRELRYQTASDLRAELRCLQRDSESGRAVLGPQVISTVASSSRYLIGGVIASLAIVAIAAIWFLWLRSVKTAEPSLSNATFSQLTDQSGQELFPSLSQDGKTFIYSSAAAGNWDIYLQRVGGRNPVNLTKDSPADDMQPALSPDGEHIVFRSERSGGGIFVMGATGESPKRVTDFGYNPAWSPDGKEIVCAKEGIADSGTRTTRSSQLWAIKIDTSERRMITDADAVQPSWSPHNQRIAYWTIDNSGNRDVWTVSVNGGEPTPVTNDAAVDWNPVWSPDGKYLYFLSDRRGSMNIWRVLIDEQTGKVLGDPEPVTTPSTDTGHFSFSADGHHLAYVQGGTKENIQRIGFDPVKEKVIGPPAVVTESTRTATHPFLSPDDEWLVFSSVGAIQEDLFVMKTDGAGLRQLTDDKYKDRLPRWSPDGKRIAFYSNRSGNYEIWTINPDGSGLQQITFLNGPIARYPFWSPDNTQLAYIVHDRATYMIDPARRFQDQTPSALPPLSANSWFEGYDWSPDGKRIVGYARNPDGSLNGVYVYSLASQQYEKLTDSGDFTIWMSDNRRVLFVDKGKVFVLDSQTKKAHEVFSLLPQTIDQIVISRDQRTIYFAVNVEEADIWLMSF